MKYLQIYDHLGNLVKEFEVYVDGQDFNWGAPKPEPVWLGTIRLASEKAVVPVEPTPEPEFVREYDKVQAALEREEERPELESELEPKPGSVRDAELEVLRRDREYWGESPKPKSEVKHEPKKRSHKSRRSKRVSSPASPKRPENIS